MSNGLTRTRWASFVPGLALLAVLTASTTAPAQSLGRGPLTMEESVFVGELLGTYGSPDLARVWIQSRIKTADSGGRASLEFALVFPALPLPCISLSSCFCNAVKLSPLLEVFT